MLFILVGLILLIIFIVAYGAWMRKRTFAGIDRSETRREELLNLPIAKELSKVKNLNMAGDTESKFDLWHKDWDTIVTQSLPEIEETLFKAEEFTEKYRFHKADLLIKEAENKMTTIDSRIKEILSELNTVLESETKNREEVTPIKEIFHQIKKELITKRSQFHRTLPSLEKSVQEIENQLKSYETETENGNYLEARKVLLDVKQAAEKVQNQIKAVPGLYQDLHKAIPDQIKELRQGQQEMIEQEYNLDHLQIDTQLEEIEKHCTLMETAVNELSLEEAKDGLSGIHDQMDWLYAQLEKEVISRKKLQDLTPKFEENLVRVEGKIKELNNETEIIRDSYHIGEEDLKMQHDLGKSFQKLERVFSDTQSEEQQEAFSSIYERIDSLQTDLAEMETVANEFSAKIKTLRKDEMNAREQIQKLKKQLFETKRIIQKSNLPGVPGSFSAAVRKAGEQLESVYLKLDEKPLNMVNVQSLLTQASEDIENVFHQAEKLVDTANFAEEMIRYGNRYRTDYQDIDQELKAAERYFRTYDYQAAVETAVRAIEKKEPKILKRAELYEGHEA
ncbi:septation ring formation regulator EzrA [Sporolactobacillus kofuensis]|uniref:Septation ring formation regulator EzrA n=1 Tax=Sporolactobacillus kofuensis TaxID=269672 RepID=A0ABW1WCB0_9BACL|nr:septation ring formation regulator EzrA [Sporolactobacillus kofuensis]MCO7175919.1 selenide, water dikinase [Sporolactobacillus kofuensis]